MNEEIKAVKTAAEVLEKQSSHIWNDLDADADADMIGEMVDTIVALAIIVLSVFSNEESNALWERLERYAPEGTFDE